MESMDNSAKHQEKKDNLSVFVSAMNELNSENQYFDVSIQVGNQIFRSNRFALAALSEYFHAMFGGNFKEKSANENEPIILHDIDDEAFKIILNFMYTGDVLISLSNVCSLFIAVDFLKLRNSYIEKKCTEFILKNSQGLELMPNVMNVFKLSCVNKKIPESITNLLRRHICQHLSQLSTADTFRSISFEDLKELLQHSYPFFMCNQDEILTFIIGWVYEFHKERKCYFEELVKLVDLKKVSPYFMSLCLNKFMKFEDTERGNDTSFEVLSLLSVMKNNAQSENIITFVKDNFSSLKKDTTYRSPSYLIQNLLWKIHIKRTSSTNDLEVYLRCDGHPEEGNWEGFTKYELSILSHKGEDLKSPSKAEALFNQKACSWGYRQFISWEEVIDPENGYIKDDIVVFQACVMVEN